MAGRQLPVQPKIHAVGTTVLRCVLVDRYAYARNDLCNGFRKVLHLVVPGVTAHVDRQECPRRRIPGDGPVERPCHVPDVDQRSPWRAVAQDRNLLGTDRTCDKVIDDQVEPQSIAHPAGGGEPQASDREVLARQRLELGFRADLRFGVGGERVQRRSFFPGGVVRHAVHAAAGRKDETPDPRGLGSCRKFDAGAEVDVVRDFLESLAHRVVGYGGEVHDGVDALQYLGAESAHIGEILDIGTALGKYLRVGEAVREVALVQADQCCLGIRLAKALKHRGPDITGVTCNQYPHFIRSPFSFM